MRGDGAAMGRASKLAHSGARTFRPGAHRRPLLYQSDSDTAHAEGAHAGAHKATDGGAPGTSRCGDSRSA